MSLLAIEEVSLSIGETPILHDISLSLAPGRVLAIVGESGSGKSMTALSAMRLLPHGSHLSGSIEFDGYQLANADEDTMMALRGNDIGMIFQEPMTALNPVHTIGDQISEGIMLHMGTSRADATTHAEQMLERVGLPASRYPLSRYPHQLSGGQRQRVMIAMACALSPKLLIADEPTTALDVTLQAQILALLRHLVDDTGMGLVLISHDLAVVADMADDIVVMKDGHIVDQGSTLDVLRNISHPYTRQLAEASSHRPERQKPPIITHERESAAETPLLSVKEVVRDYPTARKSLFAPSEPFRAVDHVSFNLYPYQSLGLVGESGCGKSTLARMVLGLDAPTAGQITLSGTDLASASPQAMQDVRRQVQVVFQDPYASFNPRHRVERLVAEPLYLEAGLNDAERRDRVAQALEEVGLSADAMQKYPHEFSGGQRQRLAIARALITRPALIVADEPVSALDVSIRAKVLDLFAQLRDRLGIAYLFISHDLGVVRAICDEVLVMQSGRLVERGPVDQVFDAPQSQAARDLVKATPDLKRALASRIKKLEQTHG
ncbi:MAG: dipeptide ABC transporter ATP-binding protein [Ahrensia sp.]|nr:dipeptide ABC transporter ATP-binding protein [Ahrensia sp.]